mgnify:CR=1 FL=1
MEAVNSVDSLPEYIMSFITKNEESIKNIIIEEKNNRGDGIIYIDTHLEDERMDVVYLTYEESKQNLELSDEFLDKVNIEDKTVILINDNEYKTRFILYL